MAVCTAICCCDIILGTQNTLHPDCVYFTLICRVSVISLLWVNVLKEKKRILRC